ncbi:hypothetical protein [Kribbella catacumbae]|uniref:hypothetical protein n=1 Tax=Kribbella catacumbae TaxID=460086 RepID=UPI00035D27AA|nr:hypothetical protein [Kribbella catacumbae]
MRPLVPATVLALTLASCSSQTGTVDDHPVSSTPSKPPMSVAKAKTALLTLRDLPAGWTGGEPIGVTPEDVRPRRTYAPAECLELFHPEYELGRPSTAAQATFDAEGDQRIFETVQSWPAQQAALVQKVTDALPRCATFTVTDPADIKTSFKVRQVPLAGLADGVGLRAQITGDGGGFVMYLVYVVRGGSVLHLHLNGDKLTEADVARTARKATARLEAARK